MRGLPVACLAALLLVLLIGAVYAAEGYVALVEDANLKIAVSYPPEVKLGTCFALRFQADAFSSMTIETIRLKVIYYYNGGSSVLYDEELVASLLVDPGWVLSKTISICIPQRDRRDPFMEAEIEAEYRLDAEERELSHEWYMSIVRDETYEEVLSQLESAEDRVASLEDQVEGLLDEIEDLTATVGELQAQLSELTAAHQSLLSDYNALQESYGELQQDYQELNEQYRDTLVEYERLRAQYEQLSSTYKQLSSNYQSVLKDYHETVGELAQLKAVYQDLQARYEDLKERHDAALTTIGGLKSNVEDLKSRLAEKEDALTELQAMYHSAVNEGTMTRSVLYAQSAAVAGIGAGIMLFMAVKRRKAAERAPRSHEPKPEACGNGGNEGGNGRVQRVLSGRRVTLPKEAAEKLGIKQGGRVVVQVLEDGVKITPLREEAENQESGEEAS